MISILANIARKVDRLEYGLDGAPVTRDESRFDTAADLLVYCLKYQAYLADRDPETASRMFGGSGACPPYSDGPAGFEVPLSRTDLAPLTDPGQPADKAALLVVALFTELEACFDQAASARLVPGRLDRLLALTDAAIGLAGALRCEHAQAYVRFTSLCLAIEEGGGRGQCAMRTTRSCWQTPSGNCSPGPARPPCSG